MNKMSYNELLLCAKEDHYITLYDVRLLVESLSQARQWEDDDFDYDAEDYSRSPRQKLKTIARLFKDDTITISGTADDYHNIAVGFARNNDYLSACIVSERGLEKNQYDIDLLSDLLHYRLSAGEFDKCESLYDTLRSIGEFRWTWRAFSFSLDYLAKKVVHTASEQEAQSIVTEALRLADDYIARFPEDRAYFDKAELLRAFGGSVDQQEEAILREGINRLRVSPRCSLRYADILFERGKYTDALKALKRCFVNKFVPQPDINSDYAFLVMAFSKISLLFKNGQKANYTEDEVKINDAYKDIHTAVEGLTGIFAQSAHSAVKAIQAQTGIDYPYPEDFSDMSMEEQNDDY